MVLKMYCNVAEGPNYLTMKQILKVSKLAVNIKLLKIATKWIKVAIM